MTDRVQPVARVFSTIKSGAGIAAPWMAAAVGVAFPTSTALEGILIGIAIALLFLSGDYADRLSAIGKHPITIPIALILALYGIGTMYSPGSAQDIWHYVSKAIRILLILLFIPLFQDRKIRLFALGGFQAASVVVLFISYAIWLGLVPPGSLFKGTPEDPVVFKLHLTHNVLMAFSCFLFAVMARFCTGWLLKTTSIFFCMLTAINVMILVPGRTGQLALILLLFYFFFSWGWKKGMVAAVSVVLIIALAGMIMPQTSVRRGLDKLVGETAEWMRGSREIMGKSTIYRLDVYAISLEIIGEHPIVGSGTGAFPKVFTEKLRNANKTGPYNLYNPHNEYLLIAIQFGLVGLVIWLYLFLKQWLLAARLSLAWERLPARGLVILILSASLISSTLIDHTEGLFYYWMSAVTLSPLVSRSIAACKSN